MKKNIKVLNSMRLLDAEKQIVIVTVKSTFLTRYSKAKLKLRIDE